MASQALTKGALWMQNVDYPASWDRALVDLLYATEGVVDGFVVSANGGLGIAVTGGRAIVQGDEVAGQGKYLVDQDATVTLTLAAVGSTRTEYVWISINDPAVAGGRAGDNVTIETSTVAPGDSALLIATLTLPAGTATITAGMIADSRVFTDTVAASSITTAKIADDAITTAKIAAGAVGTTDIADSAVTSAKIADGTIATGDIANSAISTAKIADAAVTNTKLSAALQAWIEAVDPADAVIAIAGSTAPTGWVLCDGSPYSRTTYAATFARIGTVYGAGDGSTTFNVPDLRNRFIAGKGTTAWSDTLNEAGGSKDAVAVAHTHVHTHGIDHDHGSTNTDTQSANHTHGSSLGFNFLNVSGSGPFGPYSVAGGSFYNFYADQVNLGVETANHTHPIDLPNYIGDSSGAEGAVQSPTASSTDANLPPYRTLNYCIRLR